MQLCDGLMVVQNTNLYQLASQKLGIFTQGHFKMPGLLSW